MVILKMNDRQLKRDMRRKKEFIKQYERVKYVENRTSNITYQKPRYQENLKMTLVYQTCKSRE